MPLPKAEPQRIVVLGDSGCRMKKADNAWQACGDAAAWPFETVANAAAEFKPDLVMHVGDYHYRENACPADVAGCKASPWGCRARPARCRPGPNSLAKRRTVAASPRNCPIGRRNCKTPRWR